MVWNHPDYQSVSGVFDNERKIQNLLDALEARGIGSDQVSLMMTDTTREGYVTLKDTNMLPEGASLGAVSGGLLGALLGGLTMVGTVLIPGVGLLAAGPIVGGIAGGAFGVASGGFIGSLIGLGIPKQEAEQYQDSIQQHGNVLMVANVPLTEVQIVRDLFRHNGAHHIQVQLHTSNVGG